MKPSVFHPVVAIFLVGIILGIDAFAPTSKVVQSSVLNFPSATKAKPRVKPIKYRVLDEQDDDSNPSAMKLLSRAPPNFKMREALGGSSLAIKSRSAINKPLVKALQANQYGLLALATVVSALVLLISQGPDAFSHLDEIVKWSGEGSGLFDFQVTTDALLLGVGGAMPMLAFSNWIEASDKRIFSNLNFSTIVLCLSLFGRRSVPPNDFLPPKYRLESVNSQLPTTKNWQALVEALTLSTVTGFCEEAIFRRQVPAILAQIFTGSYWIPFFGQALLFGLGHVSPSQRMSDNSVMVALQAINGLAFGMLLLLSGGQLVVPMIAHATYDFVTFFKTWSDANSQLEYAETKYAEQLPPEVEREVQAVLKSNPQMKKDRVFITLKRLFYIFDYDRNESLSLPEVKKGLVYYFLEKQLTPPKDFEIEALFTHTVQSRREMKGTLGKSRLSLADFLRLFSTLTGGPKKPKNVFKSLTHTLEEVKEGMARV